MWSLWVKLLQPLLAAVALVLAWSCLPRLVRHLKFKKLPPGPFSWPVLGYAPFLDKEAGHINLQGLTKKYGGVFSLYVGNRFVVVIDDFEVLKSAYTREEFLGRPEEAFHVSSDHSQDGVLSASGPLWLDQKKFWRSTVHSLQKNVRHVTMAQVRDVMEELRKKAGADVRADSILEMIVNNNAFQLGFGKTLDQKGVKELSSFDTNLLTMLDEFNKINTFFPWLGFCLSFLPKYRNLQKELHKMDGLIREEMKKHAETLNEDSPRDFIDYYLLRMKKQDVAVRDTEKRLLGNMKVLLLTASETNKTVLVWFLLLMAKYPEIQQKIQEEIDDRVGRDREPQLTDRTSLPLLDAAMMETMRFRNALHLNLARRVLRDTTLSGYDIPKDTIVFQNMTSHFRNPKYWTDPDRFLPDRFLSPDGNSVVVPEHFIPFSYGKRNCLGEQISIYTLFLIAASLMQNFEVHPPVDGVSLDIKVNFSKGFENSYLRFLPR